MKDNSLMEVRGGIKPKSCLTNACTRSPTNLAPGYAGVRCNKRIKENSNENYIDYLPRHS